MGQPLRKLLILGTYGLTVDKSYPVVDFPTPDGYGTTLRTADSRGLKSWTLSHTLHSDPQLLNCLVQWDDDTILTPLQYYVRFFDACHEPDVVPFIITCPEDGKDYTVKFVTHTRSLRWVELKLWESGTGLTIVQFRGGDLGLGELGEVSQPNPQEI